jgi:hypothetical protein
MAVLNQNHREKIRKPIFSLQKNPSNGGSPPQNTTEPAWFLQADAAQNGGHHHCCSALDVVVVAEELVAIRLEFLDLLTMVINGDQCGG